MPLRVEGARVSLTGTQVASGRRSRGLADIAPQYVAKSGLSTESELEGARGTSFRIQHVLTANLVGTDGAGSSRFPKLDECAHFHYEHVDLKHIQISLVEEDMVKPLLADRETVKHWYMRVTSQGGSWMIRRSYENFRLLDEQLHRCIYDRKFSNLPEFPETPETNIEEILANYLEKLSAIAGSVINCGPVLNWLEMDNRGYRLLVPDTDNCPINTPAVAAAYTVKKYHAQAPDELTFDIGEMISVIDMPPPEESIWWRGKRGFLVGFFPCECVSVIGDKLPRHIRLNSTSSEPSKSVLRKHGKLIAFFRSFILSRPSRRRLKQSGILKERVFGCDLGEHLQNSGHDIPLVLKCCAEFIQAHGIVDGIYRLSGVTSNIHKLRNAFDEDRVPALYEDDAILHDIHSVASLLKMYFRELPNPLCTYQLYHQFVSAVKGSHGEDLRLLKMRDVVHKLPPPHYRTLEYLMRHLSRVAEHGSDTGMTPRNVAIVWAPNLLRCREFEVGGVAALQFVGVQAVVTEFLIRYVDLIFTDKFTTMTLPAPQSGQKPRPKSLAISTPTKLLSLEEARNRALLNQQQDQQEYIEVGGGPASLPPRYHTVIELPRKRAGSKRSPLGWRMLFGSRGKSGSSNGHQRKGSTPAEFCMMKDKALTEADVQSNSSKRRLRPAKSVESLTSAGESPCVVSPPTTSQTSTLLRPPSENHNNHNRSVSHDSYFDTLQDDDDPVFEESTLDLSEIQVNFDLEDSEMRIFSEDETLIGSGSLGFGSPRPKKLSKSLPMTKRVTTARLARPEDSLSSSQSADPSPKKQKTQEEPRSRLEERLSTSVGELQFIDSVSPDQLWTEAQVHASPLLPPTSPILPHIPHLNVSRFSMPDTPPSSLPNEPSRLSMPETPSSYCSSNLTPVQLSESTVTTPDTPYTPLVESPEPPKPEERKLRPYHPYENVGDLVKTPVLETSFDFVDRESVKYEMISTESSCDSLIDFKGNRMEEDAPSDNDNLSGVAQIFEQGEEETSRIGGLLKRASSSDTSNYHFTDNSSHFDVDSLTIQDAPSENSAWTTDPVIAEHFAGDSLSIQDTPTENSIWTTDPAIAEHFPDNSRPTQNTPTENSIWTTDPAIAEHFPDNSRPIQDTLTENSAWTTDQVIAEHFAGDSLPILDTRAENSVWTADEASAEHIDENSLPVHDIPTESSIWTADQSLLDSCTSVDVDTLPIPTETSAWTVEQSDVESRHSDSPRIVDTSSDTSEWTTVVHVDRSDAVADVESFSLSEDTSISSGDSGKVDEAEKENVAEVVVELRAKPPRKSDGQHSVRDYPQLERSPVLRASRHTPEVIKVTAKLTESSNVCLSPRRTIGAKESSAEWATDTPLRSNSSGNVRQLMHKFESVDDRKGERPKTLERLSTRKTRESLELDMSDPERRERIERYKEKRRTYLREKYRADVEAAKRLPPFEKPPRKHPPPSGSSAGRRSFEAPTVSSLCRVGRSPTSPDKHRSLDFVPNESKSPEHKVTSPTRRKSSSPGNTTPPYCIKDMAAIFERKDAGAPSQRKQCQYLSSV